MAGRSRNKAKPRAGKPVRGSEAIPEARVLPARRDLEPAVRRRGRILLGGGIVLGLVATFVTAFSVDGNDLNPLTFLAIYAMAFAGVVAATFGATDLDRRTAQPARRDARRWIYGGLAVAFAIAYGLIMWKVIPNRMPSAMLHLATIPGFTLVMAIGTLVGGRFGWWFGVIGGSVVLASSIMLIARILVSAAFLAGVYGAFGKAASTFALVAVALLVEVVALLPICQVKFLMSRTGRRVYGL